MKLLRRSAFGWGPSAASYAHPTNGLVVHYDGNDQGLASDHDKCVTYWKNTRKFHMGSSRGWADIGYSFGVCPHGYVFEGRGINKVQAAQPGGNATWYSCTFMSGNHEFPSALQIQAFRELRSWLRGNYGVASAVSYHGRFVSTDCPGAILIKMVKDGSLVAGGSVPTPKPPAKAPAYPKIGMPLKYSGGAPKYSAAAKTWQEQMKKRGWGIAVDGYYGMASRAVCARFQEQKDLSVDGVVGPDTWAASWSAPIT